MDINTPSWVFIAYHICDAIATLVCDESIAHREEKINTLVRLESRLRHYISKRYPTELIHSICVKRITFILEARTVSDLNEILDMKSNYPVFDFGTWRTDSAYHLEEEELLLWAHFSRGVKMIADANERYLELGKKHLKNLLL